MDSGRTLLRQTLGPLAAAFCAAAALTLAGRRLSRWLGTATDAVSSFGLGLGVAGSALLAAGVSVGLDARVAASVCGGGALLAAWELLGAFPKGPPEPMPREAFPVWKAILLGTLGFSVWHTLIRSLAPPMDWDVLAYHLALPKLYLKMGGIRRVPWLLHSHWPHLMELIYAACLAFGSDAAAGGLHAGISWAWILAVYLWARPRLGEPAAFLGAALLAAQPAFLQAAGMAHSDGGQAFFYFLCLQSLWSWKETGGRRRLILAGIFGGLTAACKLTGMILPGLMADWIVLAGPGRLKERLKAAGLFAFACALVCGPWYAKTALETGDPVWPFLEAWRGGPARDLVAAYKKDAFWSFPADFALLLNYGPQFLLLPAVGLGAVALMAGDRLPPSLVFLLAPAAAFFPFVCRQKEAWRFLMPCYPALSLCAGWAVDRLRRRRAAAWLALVFWLWVPVQLTQRLQLLPVLGARDLLRPERSPRDAYLGAISDHYGFFQAASRALPPGSRVLFFREIRGYYFDADYQWGDPINQMELDYRLPDAEALARRLSALGITHVLVNDGIGIYQEREGYYGRRVMGLMSELLSKRARVLMREKALALYALEAPALVRRP